MKNSKVIALVLTILLVFNVPFSILAESSEGGIFLCESSEEDIETYEESEVKSSDDTADFIEETSSDFDIVDYEREVVEKIEEKFNEDIESEEDTNEVADISEENETSESEANVLESKLAEKVIETIESETETKETGENDIVLEETVGNVPPIERNVELATDSEISEFDYDALDEVVATDSEINVSVEEDLLKVGAGNHISVASPSVVINSTYDRYEIYTGNNEGTVKVYDNNGTYYDSDTVVKVIRDMVDSKNNSPILLKLSSNVQFFDFDNSNDNYVLLPEGFIEDIIAKESGNGYLNPQGINKLDHIKINLTFNNTELGSYDLFEYGVLYYLSCYEGVLGEYYYYDPNTTDIDKAATFYINNKIMDRTYSIVSEYYYKSPSGEQLSFKPTWLINSDNSSDKDTYVKQWINFPYFLIKTGEKYWDIRDSIEDSTYLSEYAEGYYEQYLTEKPYGNVSERLIVLDEIYKSEEALLNENTSSESNHPYVKSDTIAITGNYREDSINATDKLKAGGMLPYDTYAIFNLNVTERKAKSVQVYLNGEKLVSNSNKGLIH